MDTQIHLSNVPLLFINNLGLNQSDLAKKR